MTQPVQEPSQGRTDQAQDFRTRQLFRRPSSSGTASGVYENSCVKYACSGLEWGTLNHYPGAGAVIDSTAKFGGYIQTTTNGGFFAVGMPLGPAGSTWTIQMVFASSADGGQCVAEWRTSSVNGPLLFDGLDYPQAIGGPDPLGSATWYKPDAGAVRTVDTYVAVPADSYSFGGGSPIGFNSIYVNGADGQMLTADGGSAVPAAYGTPSTRSMDAGGDGSVIWWLRIRCSGKNAASAGYRIRVYYLSVARTENDNGSNLF